MKHRSIPKQIEGCFVDLCFWTPVVYFYIINRIGSIEICLAGLRKFYYPHFRNGMIRTEYLVGETTTSVANSTAKPRNWAKKLAPRFAS